MAPVPLRYIKTASLLSPVSVMAEGLLFCRASPLSGHKHPLYTVWGGPTTPPSLPLVLPFLRRPHSSQSASITTISPDVKEKSLSDK